MSATEDIAAERRRQIDVEGYTRDHDLDHGVGELVHAAGAYLGLSAWPWSTESFKPSAVDGRYHRRDLIRAGALVAAAIDRLDAVAQQSAQDPVPAAVDGRAEGRPVNHEVTHRQEIFGRPEQYIAMPAYRGPGAAAEAVRARVEQLVKEGVPHTVDGLTISVRRDPAADWTDRVDIYTYADTDAEVPER